MIISKRCFDIVAAAIGGALLAPLLLAIAVAIVLDNGTPVFFRQERVGRGGLHFRIWKFRTMVAEAERQGPQLTVEGDLRITRIGALLRRTKLDELPQLVNVIVGEMSLVGPRPDVPRYVALYTDAERPVLDLIPGITDPASVRYWNESALLAGAADPERFYIESIMPAKVRLNLEYSSTANLRTDIRVIFSTLRHLLPSAAPATSTFSHTSQRGS